jgi:hypothetical protein
MRLWWWRKVRYATIPKEARDIFERYGEFIISSVVTGGMAQRHGDLQKIYTDPQSERRLTCSRTRKENLVTRLRRARWNYKERSIDVRRDGGGGFLRV